MAKGNLAQTNFTAGELSPRLLGREDIVRYQNGAKRIENCMVLIQGGAFRRPGLEFIVPAKLADKRARLIPYVFNVSQAYHIEIGDGYMRFYTADGEQLEVSPGVPVEIASPYTEAQIPDIDFTQRADTMILFHEDVPTYRLQRFGDTRWRLMPVPWVTEPFDELGDRFNTTMTLSAATVGTGRTLTAGAASFVPADVGRQIEAFGGIGTITGYTSSTVLTVSIEIEFAGTAFAAYEMLLAGSPQTTVTPTGTNQVGATITLTAATGAWRPQDVGRHVVINGGLVRVDAFSSDTVITGELRTIMGAVVAAEANAWALCRSMWGQEFGYPRTGAFFQQRLWPAGSPGFPQSVWMSRLAEYYDFEIGTEADSGFEIRIDSDQANPIRHVASGRALAVLTLGSEFIIRAAGDGGIKPGNIDADQQSSFGCNNVAPLRVGSELLFGGQSGRKIRAYSPDRFDASNWAAPDLTALSEHITESGIIDMDAYSEPEGLVMAVRADGQIAALTLDRDNDVTAFSRFITDGGFESVSVAPSGGTQVALALVRRVIGGNEVRYVEAFRDGLYMDSAVSTEDPVPFDTVSGLGHLEGKTVVVRADDVFVGEYEVTGGSITITRTCNKMEIGLPFIPLVDMLTPTMSGPWGSAQGLPRRDTEVTILVKDTVGARINGRDVIFRRFGSDVLDQPPEPYTGPERIEQLGWERGKADMVIEQPRPEPFHLLAVIRQHEVSP